MLDSVAFFPRLFIYLSNFRGTYGRYEKKMKKPCDIMARKKRTMWMWGKLIKLQKITYQLEGYSTIHSDKQREQENASRFQRSVFFTLQTNITYLAGALLLELGCINRWIDSLWDQTMPSQYFMSNLHKHYTYRRIQHF